MFESKEERAKLSHLKRLIALSHTDGKLMDIELALTQLLHFEKFSKKLHLIFSLLAFLAAKSAL